MTQFLTGAPLWVWPLLALLIFIGLRARQDRKAPVALFYALPLLGIMTLRTVAALPGSAWIWLVFTLAYLIGAGAGFIMQERWTGAREGRFVHLRGELLTLSVMMIVFWANFVSGVVQAVSPATYASGLFHMLFAGLLAACAGSFAGRAMRIWQMR